MYFLNKGVIRICGYWVTAHSDKPVWNWPRLRYFLVLICAFSFVIDSVLGDAVCNIFSTGNSDIALTIYSPILRKFKPGLGMPSHRPRSALYHQDRKILSQVGAKKSFTVITTPEWVVSINHLQL